MNRKKLLVLAFSFGSILSFSQNTIQLDGDRFSITMREEGALFFSGNSAGLTLVDGPWLVYASNLWLTGYDQTGQLRGAVARFLPETDFRTQSGFTPGTINTDSGAAVASLVAVTNQEIQDHKEFYRDPGYEMPSGIANWPANGDTTIGEMWQMAPFVDLNGNEVYEPENGEYPDIVGEQCIYMIKNDLAVDRPRSIGMEIHFMISMFDVDAELSNVLDNTVLMNFTIYHRGDVEIDALHVVPWFDADLGNPLDDYIASSEAHRGMVLYNGDNLDEDFGPFPGFGENPPAFAIGSMFCNMWGTMFTHEREAQQVMLPPVFFEEFHYYSKSTWRDSTCLIDTLEGHHSFTAAGDSYNATRFAFNGTPGTNEWTEARAGRQPADRRMIPILLPKRFYPDDKLTYTIALHVTGNQSNTASENAVLAFERLPLIENLLLERYGDHPLLQASTDCATVPVDRGCDPALAIDEFTGKSFKIYPNPTSGEVHFQFNRPVSEVIVLNTLGQKVTAIQKPEDSTTLKLPTGQYVAQIRFAGGALVTEKLVVL